ncbi:hypothetical protein [Clostridium botulinum]|uniref:hypothetical protein n=1 Tax=Clostridium botulinum TaxID=1491 RepID=UPI001C9B884D|nr:hypothetical protein [Clostridium botulinum]MBY6842823.1 hypothetical protein [Clostridium botulinum]
MKELWNGIDFDKRKELLNSIYGDSLNYMASYKWHELPYGIQKRLENLKTLFDNKTK